MLGGPIEELFGCYYDVLRMSLGCLLCAFCVPFVCVLDILWMSFAWLLGVFDFFDVFWMPLRCHLDVFLLRVFLDVFGMSLGCLSDAFWMRSEYFLDVFWVPFGCFGCFLDFFGVFWMSLGFL